MKQGNVFLIGPMGAGKSTIGRHLAGLLHKQFRDCDHEVEHRTGAAIALIFEIEGEAGFRRRESAALEDLTSQPNIVLATGGGAVLSATNRDLLKSRGTVVYLHADLDTLVRRTHRDRNRPLLQGVDRRRQLEDILQARDPLYRSIADLVVETDFRSPGAVAQEVAQRIKDLWRNENAAC